MFYAAIAKPVLSLVAVVAIGVGAAVAVDETPASHAGSPSSGVPVLLASSDDTVDDASNAEVDIALPTERRSALQTPAPAAGRQDRVEVEIATTGNNEDIVVLRGNQQAVQQTQQRMMQMMAQAQQAAATNVTPPLPTSSNDHASLEQLEMETKYWELRAEGLRAMAHAKRSIYKRLKKLHDAGSDTLSAIELAKAEEMVAEATLLEADVYQARAKAIEVKNRMDRLRQQPQDDPGPTTNSSWNLSPDMQSSPRWVQVPSAGGRYDPLPAPARTQPSNGESRRADPSAATGMLLPGEVVAIHIHRERPQPRDDQYALRINESGFIDVPGTNRVARIAGDLEAASEKVLNELRRHHAGYADVMGMEVTVKRIDQPSPAAVLSAPPSFRDAEPPRAAYAPSQPQTPLPPNAPRQPSGTWLNAPSGFQSTASYDSSMAQLRRELEALKRENQSLQQRLDVIGSPRYDAPAPDIERSRLVPSAERAP